MAFHATHRAIVPLMPAELLQEICKNLDRPDLRSLRLVCKDFAYASEIFLFRQIQLKRNVESFMKFRLVASHPRLSKLVKALYYSGMVLGSAGRWYDFETWSQSVLNPVSRRPYLDAICEYSTYLTRKELQLHYRKLCALYHSQQLMQKYNLETEDLANAFAKLPQLDEVFFECGESSYDSEVTFNQLSFIGRETLVEPQWRPEIAFHSGQFPALLQASHTAQKPLSTIKAYGVCWSVFQQSEEVSAIMTSATKACQYLAIEIEFEEDRKNGRANLTRMISSSTSLHTL